MINLSFHCENTPTQREAEIIGKYWALKEGKLVNKPLGIAKEYKITVPQLKSLVKEYSWVIVTYARCMDCEKSIQAKVQSQREFNIYQDSRRVLGRRCDACWSAHRRKTPDFLYKFTRPINQRHLEIAVDEKRWCDLNDEELDVLKRIVKYRGKSLIDREVFRGNPDNAAIWHIVECIARKNLIYVEKSVKWSIEGIDFSRRLEKELFGTAADVESESGRHPEPKPKADSETFRFALQPNLRKKHPSQDDYAGTFELTETVSLKAGVKYNYRGYTKPDGSVTFVFQPVSPFLPEAISLNASQS